MLERLSKFAGGYFWVHTLVWRTLATSLARSQRGTILVVSEGGTAIPLLKNAASAPRRRSHASASNASHVVAPKAVKFGGCSPPHLMWDILLRAMGFQVIKCSGALHSGVLRQGRSTRPPPTGCGT